MFRKKDDKAPPADVANATSKPVDSAIEYDKKAKKFGGFLIVILVLGLSVQSWINYKKRKDHDEQTVATLPKAAEDSAPTAQSLQSGVDQFRDQTEEEARRVRDREELTHQQAKRNRLRDELSGKDNRSSTGGTNDNAQSGSAPKTREEILEQFALEDYQRALRARYNSAAIRSTKRDDATGPTSAGTGAKGANAAPNAGDKVDDQISRIQQIIAKNNQTLAQIGSKSESLQEAIGAAGKGQLTRSPLEQLQALQRQGTQGTAKAQTVAATPNTEVIGEAATKRQQDSGQIGPKPGEMLLPTASVISATMTMDLKSDYDGPFRGLVTRDVYDVNKDYVLIPVGSKIFGQTVRFSKVNEVIQNRMGYIVKWIILPDGKRIDFGKSAAVDHAGIMGMSGEVDYHLWSQFFGVAAYAVIGLGPSFTAQPGEPNSSIDAAARELTSGLRTQGRALAQKYLNVVPTITINNGDPFKVILEDDVYLKPWKRVDDTVYKTALQ